VGTSSWTNSPSLSGNFSGSGSAAVIMTRGFTVTVAVRVGPQFPFASRPRKTISWSPGSQDAVAVSLTSSVGWFHSPSTTLIGFALPFPGSCPAIVSSGATRNHSASITSSPPRSTSSIVAVSVTVSPCSTGSGVTS
jgi:putative alpha-1,2-mannosidase